MLRYKPPTTLYVWQKSAIPFSPKSSDCILQSCSLEDVIIPLFELCIVIWIFFSRHVESVAIVDSRKVLCSVIVESGIHYQHHAYPRGLSQQPLFSEGIRLQQPILERSDCVLGFLIPTVQRREIEV